ncbi:carbohydrate ABC transporter permease [Halalkalibacter kiskunsagensis]|uniref:Carbohydrate ABC transporter permease n=1 Tax=Halalkalibacter kiskunsagensis TaxID=1548599 RepID=A0ABV6KG84_9BACI
MYNEKTWIDKLKVVGTFAVIPLFAFSVVMLLPLLLGIAMTFTTWTGFAGSLLDFRGFENYRIAFTDPGFWDSMGITFKYVAFTLVFTNVIAFGLALLVTSGLRGQNFFRMGFFTPNLIGGIILGFIWQFIFTRVIVYFGEATGMTIFQASWLADPNNAFWTLVIVGVWQSSGYMMLIYIAGLAGINKSLLEAADLDGANAWQKMLKIQVPLMIPAFTISLFLTLQRSFLVYDVNLSLTNGGPFRSTELIAMHIYNDAFLYQNYGSGQAKAFILFLIVAAIAISQVKIMKKMEVES